MRTEPCKHPKCRGVMIECPACPTCNRLLPGYDAGERAVLVSRFFVCATCDRKAWIEQGQMVEKLEERDAENASTAT